MILDLFKSFFTVHGDLFGAVGSVLPYIYGVMIIAGLYKIILNLIGARYR